MTQPPSEADYRAALQRLQQENAALREKLRAAELEKEKAELARENEALQRQIAVQEMCAEARKRLLTSVTAVASVLGVAGAIIGINTFNTLASSVQNRVLESEEVKKVSLRVAERVKLEAPQRIITTLQEDDDLRQDILNLIRRDESFIGNLADSLAEKPSFVSAVNITATRETQKVLDRQAQAVKAVDPKAGAQLAQANQAVSQQANYYLVAAVGPDPEALAPDLKTAQQRQLNSKICAPTPAAGDRQHVLVISRNPASLLMTLDQAEQLKAQITENRIAIANPYVLSRDEAFFGC